jgi:hypothetical protein
MCSVRVRHLETIFQVVNNWTCQLCSWVFLNSFVLFIMHLSLTLSLLLVPYARWLLTFTIIFISFTELLKLLLRYFPCNPQIFQFFTSHFSFRRRHHHLSCLYWCYSNKYLCLFLFYSHFSYYIIFKLGKMSLFFVSNSIISSRKRATIFRFLLHCQNSIIQLVNLSITFSIGL